jgi:alpha-N-arabinofuranosidase
MVFVPKAENEKAGLLVFQNETHYYFLCKSLEKNEPAVRLFKSTGNASSASNLELLASHKLSEEENNNEIYLKIESHGDIYSFSYGFSPNNLIELKDSVDGKFLSTKAAGGFVGCMYALYATSSGEPSGNISYFDWFKYNGNDEKIIKLTQ